jgi:hypothetical protein
MLAGYIHYTSLYSNTLLIVQDLFIKLPGFFKELPRNQTITLARLLLIFFSLPFSFQVFAVHQSRSTLHVLSP